jgi:sensor domain DACNV-containing protein
MCILIGRISGKRWRAGRYKLNFLSSAYQLQLLENITVEVNFEFHEIKDLVERIDNYRINHSEWSSKAVNSLDKENLNYILELCLRLSLQKEEGRYLQFRLVVCEKESGNSKKIVAFKSPHFINEGLLRRLVLSTPYPTHGLRVYLDKEKFYCDGIVSQSIADYSRDNGRLPKSLSILTHGVPDFVIHVRNPGEIWVTDRTCIWIFEGNRIQELREFNKNPVVKCDLSPLINDIVDRFDISDNNSASYMDNNQYYNYITYCLCRVLSEVIDNQHGGVFIILPNNSTSHLELNYETEGFELGKELEKLFNSTIGEFDDEEETLFLSLSLLARLTNIDGCVVLNRSLRLIAFGAKITAPGDTNKNCVEWVNGQEKPFDITNLGTRHQSAYRFCASCRGGSAYVISQDGTLRIFFGRKDKVVFVEATATPVLPTILHP